jgi:hypothetical protein
MAHYTNPVWGVLLALTACSGDDPLDGRIDPGNNGQPQVDAGTGPVDAGMRPPPVGPVDSGQQPVPDSGTTPGCVGLQCQQVPCTGGAKTTVSGTIYDPAGANPLYNVVVYVPNEELKPLSSGASCDTCDALYSGKPIATTLTDAAGKFVLENAPIGANIPLVIQVGKWRRKVVLPRVEECKDNPQADKSLRLPKNRSEGDLPNIAIATGGADTLECLLRRIGVDASEYVPGAGDGGVHVFQGAGGGRMGEAPNTNPPAPEASQALWNSLDALKKYDIVLLSCEGAETENMNQQALHDYADLGGRVFTSHFHYSWFNSGPYASENIATWLPGSNDIGDISAEIVTTLPNGAPFPKGQALKSWLGNVQALDNGTLSIEDARHNADVTAANTPTQTWIVADQNADDPGAVQYLSFNTPTSVANTPDAMYCGRVVYSDLHVGAASGDDAMEPVPTGCTPGVLSPQEKALEFMLFDLSSCVTPDTNPPVPPPVMPI